MKKDYDIIVLIVLIGVFVKFSKKLNYGTSFTVFSRNLFLYKIK